MKYYVTPKNKLGKRTALTSPLVDMTGVDIIDLTVGDVYSGPAGDCVILGPDAKWASYNGREIMAEQVAICIANGLISK